ncbi:alpha/beta fold hydrolase [Euzebyella saccharophila]|uniref:Alpha/beta fold hydrolase n=1 Tax=Euzebyella saccharophila TaxID=679664 RepID=A0ABV8JPG2_9FLAO|nr:alpha/beta hydrolase [Euzebyella saccharophila]
MKTLLTFLILCLLSCNGKSDADTESFLHFKQHKIQLSTTGKGKPLLFVHGGYLDLDMWQPQVEAFKDSYTLIRFSDLGHGKTVASGEPVKGHEIIREITKKLPDEKYTLIGLSWGAMLSVDFALNYPEKVEKLVLVSPGLNGWDYFQDSVALQNYQGRQEAIKKGDTLRAAKLFHQNWVVGPRRNPNNLHPDFYERSLKMVYRTMRNHWQEDWSALDSIPARNRLEEIQVPTYIIIGSEDAEDILLIAEEYHVRIPHSKKIILPNVAHLLNMEAPERFNEELQGILVE